MNLRLPEFWRIKRAIRFFWQRRTRGFDDSETWSLDHTFARFAAPRIKRFRQVSISYPMGMEPEAWDAILAKIQLAFELVAADRIEDEERPEIGEGLELFAKWYQAMWWWQCSEIRFSRRTWTKRQVEQARRRGGRCAKLMGEEA